LNSQEELEFAYQEQLDLRYSFLRYKHPDIFRRCCEIGWAISRPNSGDDNLSSGAKAEAMAISLAFDLIMSQQSGG
jgi:hypothetical protein